MERDDWPDLKAWFLKEGVDYPWGEHPGSYAVWISEIMLQQTQVRAVIPYFLHWMEAYPDLPSLASAPEEQVLLSWEGLGYYSRVRNIHKCAKWLVHEGMHELPRDYDSLIKLPGIGPYTAAAVLSIAYGQPVPVLDANVRRLCQRWGLHELWSLKVESFWMERLSSIIQDCHDPGLFNCALMQLGQLVCRKSSPDCEACPLGHRCLARIEGRQADIPAVKKKKIKCWTSKALLFYREGEVFLEYRDRGIGKGLWSLPRISEEEAIPAGWQIQGKLKMRNHLFTTNKETLIPLVLVPADGKDASTRSTFSRTCWQKADKLSDLAMPAVYRRIMEEFRLFLQ